MIHQQTKRLAGSILQVLCPTLYITGSEIILVVVYILLNIYLLCCFVSPFFDSRHLLSTLDFFTLDS